MLVKKNLEKGDFITVIDWKHVNDNSYRGDCMEVVVIDLPLLRVIRHNNGFIGHSNKITLNTDQVNIQILTKAFVEDVLKTQ